MKVWQNAAVTKSDGNDKPQSDGPLKVSAVELQLTTSIRESLQTEKVTQIRTLKDIQI